MLNSDMIQPQGYTDPQRTQRLKNFSCNELIEQITGEKVCCRKSEKLSAKQKQEACMLCFKKLQIMKKALASALSMDSYLNEIFEKGFKNISNSLAEVLGIEDPLKDFEN